MLEHGQWHIIPWVCRAARLNEHEALKTFNMGLGMVLVVNPQKVDDIMDILKQEGETPFIVGQIVPGVGEVTYVNQENLFAPFTQETEE